MGGISKDQIEEKMRKSPYEFNQYFFFILPAGNFHYLAQWGLPSFLYLCFVAHSKWRPRSVYAISNIRLSHQKYSQSYYCSNPWEGWEHTCVSEDLVKLPSTTEELSKGAAVHPWTPRTGTVPPLLSSSLQREAFYIKFITSPLAAHPSMLLFVRHNLRIPQNR